ncbi:MAG TPA: hypothetical protein PKW79_07415 [Rhabdochlamydiaceae bacterium]|nr:hypothetical protein [Rhabdochlamydiaceae bacterium]
MRPLSSTNPRGVGLVKWPVAALLPLTNYLKIIDFFGQSSFATPSLYINKIMHATGDFSAFLQDLFVFGD